MSTTRRTASTTGDPELRGGDPRNSEFDRFADSYDSMLGDSIRFSGYDTAFFDERKIRELHGFLRPQGLTERPINFLNFGCGIGNSEKYIVRYFPNASVYSVDPSRDSIETARQNNRELGQITFDVLDGDRIPFSRAFDVVLAANVFHHISPGDRVPVLRRIFEKMTDQGYLFIFEHNPFNPVTRKIVNACPFDEHAVLLSPGYAGKMLRSGGFSRSTIRFIHFFPKFLAFMTPLERMLRKVPLGAQYYRIASKQGAL